MSDLSTATHEAAHAVIAAAFGVRVTRVSIVPDGEHMGRCWVDRRCRRGPLVRALIYMAGSCAEQLWHERPYNNVAMTDYKLIVACGFDGHDIGALQDLCRMLVRERKRTIARVSRALMKHRTLTGKELRALL